MSTELQDDCVVAGLQKLASELAEMGSWQEIRREAIDALVAGGLSKTAAELEIGNLENESAPQSVDLVNVSAILLKTAAYVSELQAKIQHSESALSGAQSELSKIANESRRGVLTPFIDRGFSEEELGAISSLSQDSLEKLAQLAHAAPPSLGRGAGMATDSVDPLMAFLLSDV